jgi:hypothetical protein
MKETRGSDMNCFMRPSIQVGVVLLAAAFTIPPATVQVQAARISQIIEEPNPLQLYSGGSQGYLGVLVGDVDSDSANKLRLKEVRGALICLIDHDAPAAQALRVNDVLLEVNGQTIESAEAFGTHDARASAGTQDLAAGQPRWTDTDHLGAACGSQEDGERRRATSSLTPQLSSALAVWLPPVPLPTINLSEYRQNRARTVDH